MSPQVGLPYVAEQMTEIAENMTGLYEFERKDTLRIRYEIAVASSEGFDSEANRLLDFWLEGVQISPEDRQTALEGARIGDLHRHPGAQEPGHTNDAECEKTALRAAFAMPAPLLAKYQSFARRLGYPYTAEELLGTV